jgi:hypothetical protein
MKFNSCIFGEIERIVGEDYRYELERIINKETERTFTELECTASKLKMSENVMELADYLNYVSAVYSLTQRKITDKIWKRFWGTLIRHGIRKIDLSEYVGFFLRGKLRDKLNEIVEEAKQTARHFGVESITVSIGLTGVTFSFTIKI